MTGIFGPSIDSEDVENAVIAHLEYWMPTHIAEMEREKDPDGTRWPAGVERIRNYQVSLTDAIADKWPESQIPTIVVQSPGEADDPRASGDGQVDATFNITILCVAEGRDEEDSKGLARLYSSAVRQAMMQHPALEAGKADNDFASGLGMGPEGTDVINRGVEASRSLAGSARLYQVLVENVLDWTAGPQGKAPADVHNPPTEWPEVKADGGSVEMEKVAALEESGFFDG